MLQQMQLVRDKIFEIFFNQWETCNFSIDQLDSFLAHLLVNNPVCKKWKFQFEIFLTLSKLTLNKEPSNYQIVKFSHVIETKATKKGFNLSRGIFSERLNFGNWLPGDKNSRTQVCQLKERILKWIFIPKSYHFENVPAVIKRVRFPDCHFVRFPLGEA